MARKFSLPRLSNFRRFRLPRISVPRNFLLYCLAIFTGMLLFYSLPDFVITLPRTLPQPVLSEADLNKFSGTFTNFTASDAGTSLNVNMSVVPTGGVVEGTDYAVPM